jgi:hypothetical protein
LVSGRPAYQPAVQAGLSFLEQAQLASGGWEYGPGFGENANSTAMVVLALTMLGEDLTSADSRWLKDGVDPVAALLAWQGESGAFQADFGDGRFDDFFSTAQSLVALGFRAMHLGRGPIQAPVVDAPPEMTPTFTAEAATETPEPATALPEPAEAPPTTTPEPEAAASQAEADAAGDQAGAGNDTPAMSPEGQEAGGGGSIWPWAILGGGVIALALLGWRLLARRQEA